MTDLPLIRALHRDLDRAARVGPERSLLRRFRAPSWAIARQPSRPVAVASIAHQLAALLRRDAARARSPRRQLEHV